MARKPAETVQLKLRFSESLRRKLERAAAQNAQSMNAEIVRRLEKSIETEDLLANVLGGPELRTYALSMIAAFAAAGRDAAAGRPAAEWLRDPECYRSAVVAVAASLVEQMIGPEQKALVLDELKMRMERGSPSTCWCRTTATKARALNRLRSPSNRNPSASRLGR